MFYQEISFKKGDNISTKGGRGNTEYKKEFCDLLIEHMSNGLSFDTFIAIVEVSRKTLYLWVEKHEEFALAKELAFAKSQLFYEHRLAAKVSGKTIKGVNVKDICTSSLLFALKTRFRKDYTEKTDLEILSSKIQINIDKDDADL